MTDSKLVSLSVYFQGSDAAFWRMCERLAITPDLAFLDRDPENYDFMKRRENHLDGGVLAGDFRLIFDVYIWDRSEADLVFDLRELSEDKMALATDTEDSPDNPFGYTLFLDGVAVPCEIMSDEVVEETYVHKPEWVRKPLKEMAERQS